MPTDNGRPHVACGDELFEAKCIEVKGEILEEVTLERVVAVAENRLAAQLRLVVPQLVTNNVKLGIELILLRLPRIGECRLPDCS